MNERIHLLRQKTLPGPVKHQRKTFKLNDFPSCRNRWIRRYRGQFQLDDLSRIGTDLKSCVQQLRELRFGEIIQRDRIHVNASLPGDVRQVNLRYLKQPFGTNRLPEFPLQKPTQRKRLEAKKRTARFFSRKGGDGTIHGHLPQLWTYNCALCCLQNHRQELSHLKMDAGSNIRQFCRSSRRVPSSPSAP